AASGVPRLTSNTPILGDAATGAAGEVVAVSAMGEASFIGAASRSTQTYDRRLRRAMHARLPVQPKTCLRHMHYVLSSPPHAPSKIAEYDSTARARSHRRLSWGPG